MKKFLRIFGGIVSISVVAASIYGVTHTRDILDWVALRDYTPSQQIVSLADATTMQDKTRSVFYVNHPLVQSKSDFKNSCTKKEVTIVLGCYVQNKGIFLLEVTDQRLSGIVEVTAAHEVLHAMYDRLDGKERQRIDRLTAEAFASVTSQRIKDNVENYRKGDASVVPTELHSILATEVVDLPAELEEYYSQYFSNRKAITAFSQKYEQTFIDIENQVKDYEQRLESLKQSFDSLEQRMSELDAQLESERNRLDALRAANEIDEYNNSVAGFNNLVRQYNTVLRTRNAQIEEYNTIIKEYNQLASIEKELVNSLRTEPLPAEGQTLN